MLLLGCEPMVLAEDGLLKIRSTVAATLWLVDGSKSTCTCVLAVIVGGDRR